MSSRRATALRRGLLSVVSALIGLLAAEGFVRLRDDVPQVMRIRPGMRDSAFRPVEDPLLAYTLKPNYRHDAPNNVENVAYTNAAGFRDVERRLERLPGVPRILLCGDSVVMGLGLASLEETISRRLEDEFAGEVEVLNFGIAGYCTRGQVHLLETIGLAYDPDFVVVLFVDNDYEDANGQASYYAFERPGWAKAAFLRSEAFRAAALRHDWFHFRAEVDPNYALERHRAALGSDNVRVGVERLAELSRVHGFGVLIAVWPTFAPTGIIDRSGPHGTTADDGALRIERLAAAAGLECVRLAPAFLRDWATRQRDGLTEGAENPERFYTRDEPTDAMHPNARGARIAAGILHELLAERPELAR